MIRNKRILLTGGAGFIGTSLAKRLVENNDIIILDNGHRDALSSSSIQTHSNLHRIHGDVLNYEEVCHAIQGCHMVVHLASIAGVDSVLKMPVKTMKVALFGTYHVLEAALSQPQMEQFIDFSTSEVFGSYAFRVREGDVTSLGAIGEARWTYAVSKLATEHLAHNYHKELGLPAVSIRPFNIYGPGQVGEGAIRRFILRALAGEDLTVHGDGSQIRAWCYIDDIIDCLLLCLECSSAVGQVFNVGNPRSVCSIYDLARQIIRLSGSASQIRFVPWPYTDVDLRVPNIEKAREILKFEPVVDLEEGLLRTIDHFRGTGTK